MKKHYLEYFMFIISKSTRSNLSALNIYDIISKRSLFDQGEKNIIFTVAHIDVCTYTPLNKSFKMYHQKYLNR